MYDFGSKPDHLISPPALTHAAGGIKSAGIWNYLTPASIGAKQQKQGCQHV